jgi:hypothetical protein
MAPVVLSAVQIAKVFVEPTKRGRISLVAETQVPLQNRATGTCQLGVTSRCRELQ